MFSRPLRRIFGDILLRRIFGLNRDKEIGNGEKIREYGASPSVRFNR
jgi:hypothetical protein